MARTEPVMAEAWLMNKKRFSVEQSVGVRKQVQVGILVAEVIRKVGISEQTFYRWKAKYAGLQRRSGSAPDLLWRPSTSYLVANSSMYPAVSPMGGTSTK